MRPLLYMVFGAAFTGAVCVSAGRLILRPSRVRDHSLSFLTGAAAVSMAIFALAAMQIMLKGVLLAAGLLTIAAAYRFTPSDSTAGETQSTIPLWMKALFGAFFVLYLANAMAPEMSPDGSTYHLGLVARYYRDHGFSRITTNIYANLSQGVEMLFVLAFAFGKHSAAALVHLEFLVALAAAIIACGRQLGHPRSGAAAALLVFAAPIVGMDASSAYNDVALSAVLFGLFYLLRLWSVDRSATLLIPIGLLAGFGYGIKYTAFLAVPYALGVIGWQLWRDRKPLLRPLVTVAAMACLMIAPWMIKNAIVVANPVSPFLNSVFPNPYVHVSFERQWSEYLRHYDLTDRRQIPLEVTVRGQQLSGLVGPIFLLVPLALLSLRRKAGRHVMLAGLLFALPYPANIGTRFLIPALPFWSLGLALALESWKYALSLVVLSHALLSWPWVMRRYCDQYAWRLSEFPWKAALRITPEDTWLTLHSQSYSVAKMLDAKVPPGERVFSFDPLMEAYTSREVLTSMQGGENQILRDILLTPLIREFQPVRTFTFQWPLCTLRRLRLVQDATAEPDHWSVTEARVFRKGVELERAPQWRLRASPAPWDVQSAFDNSPLTRWQSWQTLRPGMFIEIDFGRDEMVDAVSLEMSDDQGKTRLHAEAADGARLGDAPRESGTLMPDRLRRSAIEEVKSHGLRYLVVSGHDYGAEDFIRKSASWGITQLGESYGYRLYHLD
ncbi:MAG: hypothetical protein ABI693_23235 [Bryobacteraceae bacterium]